MCVCTHTYRILVVEDGVSEISSPDDDCHIRDSDDEVEIGMHDVRSFIFLLGLLMDMHAL